MKRSFYLFYSMVFILSCSNEISKEKIDKNAHILSNKENEFSAFKSFIKEINVIEVPFTIANFCNLDYNEFKPLGYNNYLDPNSFIYGRFTMKEDFECLITLGATDCLLPILTVFDLSGKRISQKTLATGVCTENACYECKANLLFKTNNSFVVTDTMLVYDCDENHQILNESPLKRVRYFEGAIDEFGSIILQDEILKNLNE